MKKNDIQFHYDRSHGHPAINVKCYNFAPRCRLTAKNLGCSQDTFEKAIEFAFNSCCRLFWDEAENMVREIFPTATMYSEGRQSGWLTVHNLPDVESWDAVMLAKWNKLCKWAKAEIQGLCDDEQIEDMIRSNRWNEDGAEEYNFIDRKDGKVTCIVDKKNKCKQCKEKA